MSPRRWHTHEDSGITLDRHLRWWHDGELIEHPRIIEAFNHGLSPTDDGRFRLDFGGDWCFVTVEGPAYAIVSIEPAGERVTLVLSDGSVDALDPDTLFKAEEDSLGCRVKAGRAAARFSRASQVALGELLEESAEGLCLRLGPHRIRVPLRL